MSSPGARKSDDPSSQVIMWRREHPMENKIACSSWKGKCVSIQVSKRRFLPNLTELGKKGADGFFLVFCSFNKYLVKALFAWREGCSEGFGHQWWEQSFCQVSNRYDGLFPHCNPSFSCRFHPWAPLFLFFFVMASWFVFIPPFC